MKTTMTLALLLLVACGADNEGSVASSHQALEDPPAPTMVSPPRSTAEPVAVADPEHLEAEARERTAFDESIAARGEATAIPVPPEVERELEAEYQAALQQSAAQNASPASQQEPVDFDALFEQIRETMPPQREALLMQYVAAAQQVEDPAERDALLARLSSPALGNVGSH